MTNTTQTTADFMRDQLPPEIVDANLLSDEAADFQDAHAFDDIEGDFTTAAVNVDEVHWISMGRFTGELQEATDAEHITLQEAITDCDDHVGIWLFKHKDSVVEVEAKESDARECQYVNIKVIRANDDAAKAKLDELIRQRAIYWAKTVVHDRMTTLMSHFRWMGDKADLIEAIKGEVDTVAERFA